jgi:aminoglycoside phosphotransferase (APT) family kinase protein
MSAIKHAVTKLKCFSATKKKIKHAFRFYNKAKKENGSPVMEKATTTSQTDTASEQSVDVEEKVWGSTRRIEDFAVRKIARKHLAAKIGDRCWVVDAEEGAYNRVFIIKFDVGDDIARKFILRVPSCGTSGHWNKHDEIAFRSWALTMKYIKRNTNLPIPGVIGYDATATNDLGHPYILMEFIEGEPLYDAWDDDDLDPKELEEKRLRMLKSVATTITELRHLTFDAGGMLYFEQDEDDNPHVGPDYCVDDGGIGDPMQGYKHQTRFEPEYTDTKEHMKAKLSSWWASLPIICRTDEGAESNTVVYITLKIIIDLFPLSCDEEELTNRTEETEAEEDEATNASDDDSDNEGEDQSDTEDDEGDALPLSKETFVLAPPDLDWQNILMNPDGSVAGFIDWDWVCTVPRYLGWSSLPPFLQADYNLHYVYDPHEGDPPDVLARYRNAYAGYVKEAMIEETGSAGDGRFTQKSVLYDVVNMAIRQSETTFDTVVKLLRPILGHSVVEHYIYRCGDAKGQGGFRKGERQWLKEKLREMFSVE